MVKPSIFPPLPTLWWLITSLTLVILPHVFRLVWWIPLTFLVLVCWRYLITRRQWPLPHRQLQFIMALLLLFGIFLSYGTWFGRDASVGLLVVLCGFKLLEMKNLRDAFLIGFLSYFLIITNFLYSQTIPTALYMGLVLLVTTTTLISLTNINNNFSVRQRLRLSTTLLLQALPLMLVCFLLFPRIPGPFWNLPKDAHKGITGLSDSMSPGYVSELSLSDEVAFRVKFDNIKKSLPPDQLYWRGPVLWWTNGRDWKNGFQQHSYIDQIEPQKIAENLAQPVDYTVTLEPHNERWLFALDLPIEPPSFGKMNFDYQILAHIPARQRVKYHLRSYTQYQAKLKTQLQSHFALSLPASKHPQARELAKQWRQKHQQPRALAERALLYFNQEDFIYSYTPPLLLDGDPIDDFLFKTRQGFCEHYAAAFTVLMRAAGVPTRIVTGYLGGTYNPIGGYLVVRQRDAHAWNEIWVNSEGWVRIDPTAAVAPERIHRGIDLTLSTENPLGIKWNSDSTALKIWLQLRYGWDAINNSWNQWVLSYDAQRQKELLTHLFGLIEINWTQIIILLIFIIAIFLFGMAIWMFFYSRPKALDPVQQIYLQFCDKLAEQGLPRYSSEGPLNFANRVSAVRPDLAQTIQKIIELYIQTRYRSQPQILPQLRVAVRLFHP